ncbi:MAG: serine/threonine-protein kinase [Rhodanobacteraceae bacterium]
MSEAAARWARIGALFDELVELAPDERTRRIEAIARTDATLADEVRSLLAADHDATDMLDGDARALLSDALAARTDAMPGDGRVGAWRLLRQIGQGGMGVVYLGERTDGAYEQQVAVKLLKRGMDTHAILRRFLQERRILARLNHPHIVSLLDGGMSADGRPFYVMEHVDGQAITDYAMQHKLDVRARVGLLALVAEAVAYAHTQLVVHRDLKPSNVVVDVNGAPRVLDFGIAKLIEESGEQTRTRTGMRVLSPAYAAPEQILGEPIGTATDVYALGLMLCELLVGELPQRRHVTTFEQLARDVSTVVTERASMLAARLSSAEVVALYGAEADARRLARSIGGDIDVIIATALKREPERRYATAAAFAEDLRRWLDGRPINARADSTAYRLAKFVRRHQVGVAASLLIALSLIVGLGVALYQTNAARQQAALAQRQAERAERVKAFLIAVFKQNDPALAKGKSLSAAEILSRGRATLDTSLADDPQTRGELLTAIAQIQGNLGEYTDALATAEVIVPLLSASVPAGDPRLAEAYTVRGELYAEFDRDRDAERDLRSARRILVADPVRNADHLDDLDRELAFVLTRIESPSAALALERKVIERMRRRLPGNSPKLADHRLSFALMLEDSGDYAQAEAAYREGLPILIKAKGKLAPKVCEGESNFAGLLDRMSKSTEALSYFEQALDCQQQLYGNDSRMYAHTLFSRGILTLGLHRYPQARADFRTALGIFGNHGNDAGHARRYLGLALIGEGQFAQAASELKEAERVYREVNLPHDRQRWRARADYGYAIFKAGNAAAGRHAIEVALAGLHDVVPSGDVPEYMRPLRELGEVARAQGDLKVALDAHRRWRALALKLYGAKSREAYLSAWQLSLDLARVGDQASLGEARSLIAEAVTKARARNMPELADYEEAQRDIASGRARLPQR